MINVITYTLIAYTVSRIMISESKCVFSKAINVKNCWKPRYSRSVK